MSDNNLKEIWNISMSQIEKEYKEKGQEDQFKLWFNVEYVEDNIKEITVNVPSSFMWQTMLLKGNIGIIKEKIKQISGLPQIEIKPLIKEESVIKESEKEEFQKNEVSTQKIASNETNIKKEQKNQNSMHSSLKTSQTFENFVTREGSASNFAYKVSLSIANNPGEKANPLFIYGGVGLGKTHLMNAIGNKINEISNFSKKIYYIQAESFLNEFTASITTGTQEKFKKKYRHLDALLIDDIQFLQGKTSTQEELFYTFEELHKNHAQMVFTCDRPISEVENMTDRLVSRLGSGMCLDLQPPDFETRKAIIYKKLENSNKSLPEEVIDFIAQNIDTNIRDLESALNKILAYTEFVNPSITIEIAQEQLSGLYNSPDAGNVSVPNIQKIVAEKYGISVSDLKSKNRSKKFYVPRSIAIYISKEMTEYTYTEIGYEFGGKDHSTVMHAYNDVCEKVKIDSSLKSKIKHIMEEVKKFKN